MALNSAVTADGGEIGCTLALLAPSERARVVGFVINRFRGDLARLQPGMEWRERPDGTASEDGQIPGTYLHGLFESSAAATVLLRWAGLAVHQTPDYRAIREAALERLADSIERHLDLGQIERILCCAAPGSGTEAS